jgi:hypothetical protein
MEKTSHWAALYFVTLMTFGNYVLFNLLVAILVEGFSSEVIDQLLIQQIAFDLLLLLLLLIHGHCTVMSLMFGLVCLVCVPISKYQRY